MRGRTQSWKRAAGADGVAGVGEAETWRFGVQGGLPAPEKGYPERRRGAAHGTVG